jgi:AcrR family transcriptional regulator
MNIKNNLKAQQTKSNIKNTFLRLLEKKAVHKISVQEICKEIDINRSTFYAHFEDIYDLLMQIERDLAKQLLKLYENDSIDNEMYLKETMLKFLYYLRENKIFYYAFFQRNYYSEFIKTETEPLWVHFFKPAISHFGWKKEAELKYRFEYFRGGLYAVLKKWIEEGCKESEEHIAEVLTTSVPQIFQ